MKMTSAGLARFAQASAAVVDEIWSDTVLISGQSVACAVARGAVGGTMGLGGEIPDALLKVRILKANLVTAPIHGKTLLTFEGRTWRVDEVTNSEKDQAWALTCVPNNRG